MPHPTWFMRKEVYIDLGEDADIQGCEDYDFLICAVRNGYKLDLYKQYIMMQYI